MNLSETDCTYDGDEPAGMRSGTARFGKTLGAQATGASLYELPPGESLCPYHYEYGEEEWLLVVSGTPSVRDPDGTQQLTVGDLVFFPIGPVGAHEVRNDSDETARVLMWSDVRIPAATVYPDSDKIGIWTQNKADDIIVERSSGVGYWHGEGG